MTIAQIRRTRALVVLAFVLSLSMVLGRSTPAHALVPVVAAPAVLGGTAVAAALGGVALFVGLEGTSLLTGQPVEWGASPPTGWSFSTGEDPALSNTPAWAVEYCYYAVGSTPCSLGAPQTTPRTVYFGLSGSNLEQVDHRVCMYAPDQSLGGHCQTIYASEISSSGNYYAARSENFDSGQYSSYGAGHPEFTVQLSAAPYTRLFTTNADLLPLGNTTPTGTVETDYECTNLTTGAVTTGSASSVSYRLDDPPPRIPAATCPTGTALTRVTANRVTPAAPPYPLIDYTAPFTVNPADPLTACMDGSCELDLWRNDGGTYVKCNAYIDGLCVGWAENLNDYECRWGTIVVPIGNCEMFHQPGETDPLVDSDLSTETDRGQEPQQPEGEPSTSVTVDDGCGGYSSALAAIFQGGIAGGVGCALEAAFVPTATTTTAVEALRADLAAKAPFAEMTSGMNWLNGLFGSPLPQSCLQMDVDILGEVIEVMDSCRPDPISARLITYRPMLEVLMWSLMILPLLKTVYRRVIPILND